MRLLWISLTIFGLIALFYYFNHNNVHSSSLYNSNLARTTIGGAALLILAMGLFASDIQLGDVLKNILIWAAIITILIIGYNNRYHFQDIAYNITGGLVPASILSSEFSKSNSVTINRSRNGHYKTSGNIDDHWVDFLIDTGATSIVLTYETATILGLDTKGLNYTTSVSTANGEIHTARIKLNSLSIGSITRKNINALIAPSGALNENLLGMNFINTLSSTSIRGDQLILID